MAISRVKTWIAAEILTASDLNTEFNNIINNALSLISPLSGTLNVTGTVDINAGGTLKVTGVETLTKGADVTAATDLLVNIDGNIFDVTGATTIATVATKGVGTHIILQFDSTPQITHHATNLILPGGLNITAAAGDIMGLYEYASADWRCEFYTKADGATVGIKEFYVYAAGGGATATAFPYTLKLANFILAPLGTADEVIFMFGMPADFTTLVEAVILMVPDATETIQFDLDTDYGASGEAPDANSENETDTTLGVTSAVLTEVDASGVMASVAADDYVGLEFDSDTATTRIVLLRIRYR